MRKLSLLVLIIFISSNYSSAWIYPEHRQITIFAIQNLDIERRSILEDIWTNARMGYESRLSVLAADTALGINPQFLDFASWPAISGDHSCSPENMLYNVLHTDWILKVAHVAAQLKIDLANSKSRHEHINSLRDSDVNLQRVDPEYATRAGSNNVHFLLARPDVNTDAREYLTACLKEGAELNALGAYSWFHVSAMLKAAKYHNEDLNPEERSALILSALADEAFAIHFLEDVYAAGHTAGTWGNASQRKGTHDYYNEKGLEVVTWDGQKMVLAGDAFMREQDAKLAAVSVQLSLEQILDITSDKLQINYLFGNENIEAVPDSFNVCKNNYMPLRKVDESIIKPLVSILIKTPLPGLAQGLGEIPRFRAELGFFMGAVAAVKSNGLNGGFGLNQDDPGAIFGIDAGIRIGLGLEGVMHGGGDGLVFLDIGWRQDGASTMNYGQAPRLAEGGQITAAIPGRNALNIRFRMPFWLIPFDLLITAPILLIASPETYANMAVTSGLGGLIPWQAGIETAIGRFQFILGREVGFTMYGLGDKKDAILVPVNDQSTVVSLKSTQLDFPVLEYRPFRTFSTNQSSSLIFQLTFGVDIPYNEYIIAPEGFETPELKTVWYIGLRTAFDWRYYF